MKLCLIILVIVIVLEAVAASSFTRLLGSALVVEKNAKKNATKANVAHSKTKKIKVTPADQLLQKTQAVVQTDDVDVQKDSKSIKVAQRQDAMIGRKELFLTIAQMLLSRFILKVNYKDPKSLLYARASFVAYLILFQALIWLLKYQINKRDDNTILAVNPSSGMDSLFNTVGRISGQSAMTNTLLSLSKLTNSAAVKTLTVKAHDLEHIQKLSSKLYFDLATTSLLHYLFGFQSLVLLTPMRGLASLLKNQLVLLHVLRFKPVGKLARPFKTPMEEFMSSLANPKTPAVSPVKVESADNTKERAKSSDTAVRVEKISIGVDTVNEPTVMITTSTVTATETEVEKDTTAESDEEQVEEIELTQSEPLAATTDQETSSAGDASGVSHDAAKSEGSVDAAKDGAVETTDDSEQGGEEEEEEEEEDSGDDENDVENEVGENVENEEEDGDAESQGDDLDNRLEGEEEDCEGGDDEGESEGESEGEGAEVDATEEDLKDDDNEDNGDGNDEEEEEEGEEGAEGEDTELLNAIDQLGEYP